MAMSKALYRDPNRAIDGRHEGHALLGYLQRHTAKPFAMIT